MEGREDNTVYRVVVNHEEQYSIWPAERENALGWRTRARLAPRRNVWLTSKKSGRI
jgi:MbtH protein